MKRTFRIFHCGASKMHFGNLFGICFLAAGQLSNGAPLKSARVSAVIRDVRLLPSNAAPRPAAVNESVGLGTAVRTGTESRAELTFADLTVTRLGENTIFSFNEAARELNVTKGAILVEVPSKAPAAKITTAGVTAGVMGATALFATGPPTKFMMLEGIGTFYPAGHPERAVAVHAGEMVMMTADGRITQPTKFNVQLVLQTSHLIVDFPALANLPLILQVINQQLAEQSAGTANPLPSKNSLVDVIDVVSQNVTANPAIVATPVAPGPPVITSSVPYVINNGTVIATHIPTVTTNGVTSQGVIYHGRTIDGPLSAFLFGSTSAFDTASGFDTVIGGGGGNGLGGSGTGAGFKFTSLELAGDPTVDTANGQINLGLVGVKGITSGAPGGTLTFAGIRGLLLATQKGSINLGSEISFSGLHDLNIYARGSSSDLTLGSDISTTSKVRLFAERDMSMTSNITTDDLFAVSGRDMQIGGSATTLTINNSHGGQIGTGGNISLTTGGDLTSTGGGIALMINNTTGTINTGGNITVMSTGGVSTPGAFDLAVENYDFSGNTPGHIGTGGNISVITGKSLAADFISAFVLNRSGGRIDSAASVNMNISGALTTLHDGTVVIGKVAFGNPASLSIGVQNRFDNTSGNPALASTIGGDATLTVSADSASIGGRLEAFISTRGSTIDGNALFQFGITHDVTIQGVAGMGVLVGGDSASPLGGTIHGSATLQLSSNNFTANGLRFGIDNPNGGVIDSNATITFDLKGSFAAPGTNPGNPLFDATVPGEADFVIRNQLGVSGGTSGGTIGGNALITLAASSVSTAGLLDVEIDNLGGGHIGGNAGIGISAGNITANSLLAQINNSSGGSIGGNATINMNVSGAASVTTDATFEILGSNGVAKGAAINFNGGNYGVGGTFLSTIDGNGAITFNNASVRADVIKVGVFGTNGTLTIGGGPLTANTLLKLYAPGSNGGTLNFVANVTLSSGTAADLAANTITIQSSVVVKIAGNGGPANIFTNHPNYNFTPGPSYTGPPGNPSNGSFGGPNGALDPQPLANAPSFNASTASVSGRASRGAQTLSSANVTSSRKVNRRFGGAGSERSGEAAARPTKTTGATMNIGDSAQLLSLLDAAVPGPGGKITIPASNRINRSKNSNRSNVDGRLKANGGTAGARHVRDSADNPRLLATARSFAP